MHCQDLILRLLHFSIKPPSLLFNKQYINGEKGPLICQSINSGRVAVEGILNMLCSSSIVLLALAQLAIECIQHAVDISINNVIFVQNGKW